MRREQVIELLHGALLPLAWVNAAWLGGSNAFGRADELSDVDLQVDVTTATSRPPSAQSRPPWPPPPRSWPGW